MFNIRGDKWNDYHDVFVLCKDIEFIYISDELSDGYQIYFQNICETVEALSGIDYICMDNEFAGDYIGVHLKIIGVDEHEI